MKRQSVITQKKKRRGPRPTGKGELIGVRIQPPQLALLDGWIDQQPDKPSRPEAVRRLLGTALAQSSDQSTAKKASAIAVSVNADTAHVQQASAVKRDEQVLAQAPQKPLTLSKPVVPEQVIQLTVRSSIDNLQGGPQLADNTPVQGKTLVGNDNAVVKRKHKIHSFGDLVNLVVDKVDKRKDKVLEFTDDGDGDSNLTGVNLGIVKIKKVE